MGKRARLKSDIAEELPIDRLKALVRDVLESGSCLDAVEKFPSLLEGNIAKNDVQKVVTSKFIAELLYHYTATQSEFDKSIFNILNKLEVDFEVDMSSLLPLVFGNSAKQHYEQLRSLGPALHKVAPNQVLALFNPKTMWQTVRMHCRTNMDYLYDVRFVLRTFASIIYQGSELNCRKFIECNGLSLLFSCTSSKDISTRTLAYFTLQKYFSMLKDLKENSFTERSLYIYIIKLFKQSIEGETPRISHLISHFFARVCKLILHPEDPVYGPVLSFLCLKPQVDLNNVPEMYKLLFSSSVEHYKTEREWMLVLISEALLEPMDYNVLQNRSGIKLLLCLFGTCFVDQVAKRLILNTLKAAVSLPSAAHDLFHRCNLHSWIAGAIQNSRLTRWEQNYLAQIFSILITNEREAVREKGDNPTAAHIMARIAARPISEVMTKLRETEEASVEHKEKIEKILGKKWRKRKLAED